MVNPTGASLKQKHCVMGTCAWLLITDIFLKKRFKLFIGQHFVDNTEHGFSVFPVQLANELHLLCGRFIFPYLVLVANEDTPIFLFAMPEK
ncbi:MAG: hypothetical protein GXO89_10945 [Chlorobi bacterium]|nr:hypothetical protein [Chlorobiota bacterium]